MSAPARENDQDPTLVGQLKLLREWWGEGFDEDVAKPAARALVKLRGQLEAGENEHEREMSMKDDKIEELELAVEEAPKPETISRMEEDLRDVDRGVLDFEELFRLWDVRREAAEVAA